MISVEDALAAVLAAMRPMPAEVVALPAAHGRVLAEDLAARRSQPPVAVSAMDGYAVRAGDVAEVPVRLAVTGRSLAGAGHDGHVGLREAVRIFTGAQVPAGADAVVIQEETADRGDGRVDVLASVAAGAWIRVAGGDFRRGDILIRAGEPLTARNVGLAAAMGVPWVAVRRRPRVGILATGDELVMPGEPLGAHAIINANGPMLAAAVAAFGGEPVDLGIVGDDVDAIAARVSAAAACDLLLTIGGASVGDVDLVAAALAGLGFEARFHGVAMRPGKPVLFGMLGRLPVLGLPGNPVSAGVAALVFCRPAVAAMLGLPAAPSALRARLAVPIPANGPRQDYVRARVEAAGAGDPVATPLPRQDSAFLAQFAAADGLIVRPPKEPQAEAGAWVPVLLFPSTLIQF